MPRRVSISSASVSVSDSDSDSVVHSVFLFTKENGLPFNLIPDIPGSDWDLLGNGGSSWDHLPNEYQFTGSLESRDAFMAELYILMSDNLKAGYIRNFIISRAYSLDIDAVYNPVLGVEP